MTLTDQEIIPLVGTRLPTDKQGVGYEWWVTKDPKWKVGNYSLQACGYVRQKHVLALFLESRRPVLEQLELCVNSYVCGIKAVVRVFILKR